MVGNLVICISGLFVVFQGGKLTYIDYDTKDFTFNKMVPAAYQVLFCLE